MNAIRGAAHVTHTCTPRLACESRTASRVCSPRLRHKKPGRGELGAADLYLTDRPEPLHRGWMAYDSTISFDLSYRSGTPFPGRESARNRRRLQQHSLVHTGLSGDLISNGYFSADLFVGTPPQQFSVIVDTGSSVTAVACTGCTRCGHHANARFIPSSSTTFEAVSCSSSLECSKCLDGVCGYRVSYQEGSSYSGYLARDIVHVGVGGGCASLRLQFGCSTDESGVLNSTSHTAATAPPSTRHGSEAYPASHNSLRQTQRLCMLACARVLPHQNSFQTSS